MAVPEVQCRNCGKPNPYTAGKCKHCGKSMVYGNVGPPVSSSANPVQSARRLDEQLYEWQIGQVLEFQKPCARCRNMTRHRVRGYMTLGSICEAVCGGCRYEYKFKVIGNDFSVPLEYVGDDGKWHSPDGRW